MGHLRFLFHLGTTVKAYPQQQSLESDFRAYQPILIPFSKALGPEQKGALAMGEPSSSLPPIFL